MKIERLKMTSGELYSVLLDENGMPMPYPNLFVTINHRNKSDSSNTCHTVFEHLRFLFEVCNFLNIDLVQRCKEGDFLKKAEMESLVKWAKHKVKTFREHVAKQKSTNIISFTPKLKKLEMARAVFIADQEGDISPHTAYNRITTFAEYIGWLEEQLFPSKESTAEQMLKSLRPKKFGTGDEAIDWGEYRSLTPEQVIRVLDVVRPDSSENPWKDESIRYRNQLLVNFYEAIGCRRGELLKVRVTTNDSKGDVNTNPKNGRRFLTIRSQVDLDDERMLRPEAKTLGRHVPMDKRLTEMYDNYLIYHRSNAKGAEHIPYLFVTHNHKVASNNALSTAQVNKIFRQISEVVGFWVHPHALRHSWNDKFSAFADKRIAENKATEAKTESDRRRLQGWSDNSKSGKRYERRHGDRRAFEAGLELQEQSSEKINAIVGGYDEDILQ